MAESEFEFSSWRPFCAQLTRLLLAADPFTHRFCFYFPEFSVQPR